MKTAEELADLITDDQLDSHVIVPSGREWMATPQGVGAELSQLGKEAVRIAKRRRDDEVSR